MSLAFRYLVEKRGLTGSVVRTVSTTRMIDRLAKKYNLTVHETPVGFNHIADYMLKENVLIGGEESGGIGFSGHIPEGDGILMGLLIIEMVAESKTTLYDMVEDLQQDVGPVVYDRVDLRLKYPVSKEKMVEKLIHEPPQSLGGENLVEVSAMDGVKYIFADDSWLLIRPSGTEPVLRVYAEGRSAAMVKELLKYGSSIAESIS
jgi:phosphomannomutase